MNIIENEIPYLVEARTCGCNERGKSVSYHFIESSHALCMNKVELISGQIQACERLLKLAKEDQYVQDIPIIFFSAGSILPALQQTLINGANAYLQKPFTEEELLETIEKCFV